MLWYFAEGIAAGLVVGAACYPVVFPHSVVKFTSKTRTVHAASPDLQARVRANMLHRLQINDDKLVLVEVDSPSGLGFACFGSARASLQSPPFVVSVPHKPDHIQPTDWLRPAEIDFALAHELVHLKHEDAFARTAAGILCAAASIATIWGFRSRKPAMVLTPTAFVLWCSLARAQERRADREAAAASQEWAVGGLMFLERLRAVNLRKREHGNLLAKVWFTETGDDRRLWLLLTHPSISSRIMILRDALAAANSSRSQNMNAPGVREI